MKPATNVLALVLVAFVCLLFANGFVHADTMYAGTAKSIWNGDDYVWIGAIEKFDSSGNGSVFATGFTRPFGMAFDNSGNLYAVEYGTNMIVKVDSSGNVSVFATSPLLQCAFGLAFDSSGNLYVASVHGVMKFDSSGNGSVFNNLPFDTPQGGLAFFGGNLYAVCSGFDGSEIVKLDSSGNMSVFALGLASPEGVAFDSSGNLYVSDPNNGTIEKFDSSGLGSVFALGVDSPEGLAFDSSDNLYVVNEHGRTIWKFDTNGVGSVFASGPVTPFIAIQVPEPVTWGLVALGAVALVGGRRLRRRSS